METIRNQTFETNSSSSHSLTVGNGMRDFKEFPELDNSNRIHIPWCRFEDLDGLDTFTSIVQLLVIILVDGYTGHVEDLFKMDAAKRNQLVSAIALAYSMAGLDEVEGIVIDLPPEAHGIELNDYEASIYRVANWTEMDLMLASDTGSIKDLGAARLLSRNNTALSLVSSKRGECNDDDVLYTAALLAMNVRGAFNYA